MEYCGGGDLESYFRSERFGLAEFNRVMLDFLSGVAFLHTRGIAHRDLKPANGARRCWSCQWERRAV